MTELREYQNCHNRVPGRQIEIGEVVLVHDKVPRNRWKTGVVTERYEGADGFCRGCKIRTLTKTGRITYLNRPVNKLYPLEIQSAVEEDSISDKSQRSTTTLSSNDTSHKFDSNEIADGQQYISERRSMLRRAVAESGILKRVLAEKSQVDLS